MMKNVPLPRNIQIVSFVFLFILLLSPGISSSNGPGSPVILVPGDGGSQFEARLNKSSVVHVWCTKFTEKWFPLWLNLELLAPYILDCFVDNMRLQYDSKTRTTHDPKGVYTRQPGFGNTTSVEWLDESRLGATSYFHPIVDALVKDMKYTRGVNIRGAPYDFRKAPNEMGKFIKNLAILVEETYKKNSNQKVVLLGHSMGNPYILYLLNNQPQAWKDKHIKAHVSLSGPWGGAVKTLRLMASGDNLGVFVVNPLSVRQEQRTMPSTAWLMPTDRFWNKTDVIVMSPYRNYTVNDYNQFFKDIKFPTGWMMRQDTEKLIYDLTPPGVDVHCLHGIKVATPAQFKYSQKQWPDDQPSVIYGPGDGTVNLRSLQGCLRWKSDKSHKVISKTFENVDHMQILGNKDVISYIKSVVKT